uniref:Uncharacterized protein n=1 Tax=Rhizophora mucronata TaxID=61149 RepID=A0A2P2R5D9_RHIMU
MHNGWARFILLCLCNPHFPNSCLTRQTEKRSHFL